jgi:hypothetical protein
VTPSTRSPSVADARKVPRAATPTSSTTARQGHRMTRVRRSCG